MRAAQTAHRKDMGVVNRERERYKVCPVLSWSDAEVEAYFLRHGLPRHPLQSAGYVTVGDAHSSRPVASGEADARATRFGGKAQEARRACCYFFVRDRAGQCVASCS